MTEHRPHLWIETGGDTGGAEWYSDRPVLVGWIDWDNWTDKSYDADSIFHWIEEYGDIMPKRTRAELLTRLAPDPEYYP